MSTGSLLDNWTLQTVGELLTNGLGGGTAHEITFSADNSTFQYEDVLGDVLVDADFAPTWADYSPISQLADDRVIKTKPLTEAKSEWIEWREAFEDHWSFCPAVRERHLRNPIHRCRLPDRRRDCRREESCLLFPVPSQRELRQAHQPTESITNYRIGTQNFGPETEKSL